MKQTTKNMWLSYILILCGLLLLSGCSVSNEQDGGTDSTVVEPEEGAAEADINELCTEDSENDSVSMQPLEKRIYANADEVQRNILGYSLRRMPPNPENMYYEQDMPYLVEEELVGKGIYISDYMCETEVFLGNILKEVLTNRGPVSGENRKYFTDYALRQLEGTDWGLLDAAWEVEPFAYDREYSVNPLSGGAGYYFRYSFYPDQDRTVKEKTNKTDFTLYVDNEGRICEIKTSISTIPAAESGMEEWINTDGLADNTYCEQIIRDGRPCNEKMVWDFERHFRRFMTPEEVYEQENTGLLESGNVCASAENLAGIFSHIMQNRGADAERYKEYFSYDESYEEFADTEWRLLGEAWTAEEEYDCFFVDSIYSSGYAGFRYYFYPDYESMDVSEAKAVVIDCNINIYNGMIDYSYIDIFPFTIEEYQMMKQNRDKYRQLVIDQGNVLSSKVKVAIPVMDRQIEHIPVREFDPNAVDRSSGRRKVKEELWGFTDTAEAADDLGKKFLKDIDEDNLEEGAIYRFANDKEEIYSALCAIDGFGESGWKADRQYDCFWVRFNEAAGCMHLQYYFYPERTNEESVSGRTLVVDVFVSESGIENMEINVMCVAPASYPVHIAEMKLREAGTYEESTLREQLLHGDFGDLNGEYSDYKEFFEENWESGEVEWRQIDLNGDGTEDFILQEAKPIADTGQKRISGIFTIEGDSIRCIMSDLNDHSEYSFCGVTGKLLYTAPNYGGVVDNEPYVCYHYDSEWQEIIDYTLEIIRVDSEMDENYAKEWKRENSEMAEDGLYFYKYKGDKKEKLTKKEWMEIYEAETGLRFDGSDIFGGW